MIAGSTRPRTNARRQRRRRPQSTGRSDRSRLAAFLRETLDARENLPARHWIDPITRRSLCVETRRLVDQKNPLGAVAVVHDLTAQDNLRQKQDLVDRAAFWTDLAASMSHEIRNPLVAIKTFAQLLPERFEDPDFRKDFNQIVVQEIDRLTRSSPRSTTSRIPPSGNEAGGRPFLREESH